MAIAWDGSWIQSRRHTVEGALERIERMLTASYVSVRAVSRDTKAKATYVTHFGDAALANLASVTNVIRIMQERVTAGNQTLTMSYVANAAGFTALGIGALPAGVSIEKVEAFVIQKGVAPTTALTCYIAPAFFTGDVYILNATNQRTGTGTILHELSHGVGNTGDHGYTWEAKYATLSADLRAKNADCYRAYCQSFDM